LSLRFWLPSWTAADNRTYPDAEYSLLLDQRARKIQKTGNLTSESTTGMLQRGWNELDAFAYSFLRYFLHSFPIYFEHTMKTLKHFNTRSELRSGWKLVIKKMLKNGEVESKNRSQNVAIFPIICAFCSVRLCIKPRWMEIAFRSQY